MDSDGETIYKVPQFNMVAHGVGEVSDGIDEGQITSWVTNLFEQPTAKLGRVFSSILHIR